MTSEPAIFNVFARGMQQEGCSSYSVEMGMVKGGVSNRSLRKVLDPIMCRRNHPHASRRQDPATVLRSCHEVIVTIII